MTAHDNSAGYVVDALDDDERAAFEQHLAECAACRAEVAELFEVTAELGSAELAAPPPSIRANVLRAIGQVPQLPPTDASAFSPGVSSRPQSQPSVGVEPVVLATAAADIGRASGPMSKSTGDMPGGVQVRSRRNTRGGWIVAAAMAIVVGLSGWVYASGQRRDAEAAGDRLAAAQQSIEAQREAEAQFWSAADVKIYPAQLPDGARATFAVSASANKALFVSGNLPAPGPGKTYQLWTIHSATDVRPDVLVPGGGPVSSFLKGGVDGVGTLAVTIEPEGGSQTPTLPIQAAATI